MFRSLHSQTRASLIAVLLGAPAFKSVGSAAAFQNLDFESATLPSLPADEGGGYVPISQGIPGWRVFWGDIEQSMVLHNSRTLGSADVGIWGPERPRIEGTYTALLQAGIDRMNPTGPFIEVSIAQTGFVPADALALQFKMAWAGSGLPQIGPFRVELNDQVIPVVPLFIDPNYTLFRGDVSAFAGTTAELRFIAETIRLPNNIFLDSIVFSSDPVPEPSTWALLSVGMIGVATYIRKRSRR